MTITEQVRQVHQGGRLPKGSEKLAWVAVHPLSDRRIVEEVVTAWPPSCAGLGLKPPHRAVGRRQISSRPARRPR